MGTGIAYKQRGVLLLLTLIMLMVVSLLGLATMDATGLEMRMSSNGRAQQLSFEAAEHTLSQVENDILLAGFTKDALTNNTSSCGTACFNSSCSGGYCFDGFNPDSWENCTLNAPATQLYSIGALWTENAGSTLSLLLPQSDLSARYLIEFRCYQASDRTQAMDENNFSRVFRISAFTTDAKGTSRTMLRSTLSMGPAGRLSWERLEILF